MAVELLHYRPWRGEFHSSGRSLWPIARVALGMILRRKLFWGVYGLGLTFFLLFFFGQYLLAWVETQTGEARVTVLGVREDPRRLVALLRDILKLNGSAETYRNYFWYQGYFVMVVLGLAGSILVGNDFQFGSLAFYLSKPLSRWHYLGGKCLAVAVFVNLMTTGPAVVLFVQYGLLDDWSYLWQRADLLLGILGYGLVLTVSLSLLLVAAASWLKRTVPLIMAWTTLLFFCRLLATALVDGLHHDHHWRLIDLWHNTYLVGCRCLGVAPGSRGPQPEWYEAALVLAVVCLLCVTYLNRRIRAVEVVA